MKLFLWTFILFSTSFVNAQTTIPVVRISGNFGYEYQEGTMSIYADGEKKENLKGKIKWRGNSTNTGDKHKRNYTINLEEDVKILGMRKDNKWILDAGQADLFRLRNRIATEIWNEMAHKPYYADKEPNAITGVRGKVVELYLNDEYRGIYCLTECMDRKELKLKKFEMNTGLIHGEFWISKSYGSALMWDIPENYDNNSNLFDVFEIKYPDLNDIEETDHSILWNAIDFVVNSDDETFTNNVSDYFDMPVIIDYYIFLNVMNAFDNVGKNMIWAVYDKESDKKLTLAVWDLDGTVGSKWLNDWAIPEYKINVNHNLYVRLIKLNVDHFNEKVINRYYELRKNIISTESIIKKYTDYYELLKNSGAAKREEEKWSEDTDINGKIINFSEEIEYIKDWIINHFNYLDREIFINTGIYNRIEYIPNNKWYNLHGQYISSTQPKNKGIYIKEKRKYIVR